MSKVNQTNTFPETNESYFEYSYEHEIRERELTASQMKINRYDLHNSWAGKLNLTSMVIAFTSFILSIYESIITSFEEGYEIFYIFSFVNVVFCASMFQVYRSKIAPMDPHFWNFVSLSGSLVFFIIQISVGSVGITRLTTEEIDSKTILTSVILIMLNGCLFWLRFLVHLLNVSFKLVVKKLRPRFKFVKKYEDRNLGITRPEISVSQSHSFTHSTIDS